MTAQAHERLLLEGKETSMAYCPPIPVDHPRITVLSQNTVRNEIKAGRISPFIYSTACWRNYIGTWKLQDGKLYLAHLNGIYRLEGTEPLLADWVNTVIRIPDGEVLHYVHMGFGSVYEYETHLKIENGIVVDERRIDNRGKDVNPGELSWKNLPGGENNFDGDDLQLMRVNRSP